MCSHSALLREARHLQTSLFLINDLGLWVFGRYTFLRCHSLPPPSPPHDIRRFVRRFVRKQPSNVPVHLPVFIRLLYTPVGPRLTALSEPSHTRLNHPTRPRFRPMLHAHAHAHSLGLPAPRPTLPARTHAHDCKARAYPDGTSIGGMGKNSIARNHSLPGVA